MGKKLFFTVGEIIVFQKQLGDYRCVGFAETWAKIKNEENKARRKVRVLPNMPSFYQWHSLKVRRGPLSEERDMLKRTGSEDISGWW